MAVRYAVATGNWSSTSTWNGGTLPTSSDDVYANGFTVTIDQDITVLSLQNGATTGVNANGSFVVSSGGRIINADIRNNGTTSGIICLSVTNSVGPVTLNGNIYGLASGSIFTSYAVNVNNGATAVLNITGTIRGGTVTYDNYGLRSIGSGTINIVGDIYAGSAAYTQYGCFFNSPQTINITGNIYNASGGDTSAVEFGSSFTGGICNITGTIDGSTSGAQRGVVRLSSLGTINVYGNVIGGNASTSYGFTISSNGTVNIYGNAIGGTNGIAIYNNGTTSTVFVQNVYPHSTNLTVGVIGNGSLATTYIQNAFFGANGQVPFSGFIRFSNSNNNTIRITKRDSSTVTLTDAAANTTEVPIPANVRQGTSYLLGTKVGTLIVPNPASVGKGVPTDNTVGTAALTPEAVWNHLISNIGTAGSIGERLKNASTVQTTGEQIASIN